MQWHSRHPQHRTESSRHQKEGSAFLQNPTALAVGAVSGTLKKQNKHMMNKTENNTIPTGNETLSKKERRELFGKKARIGNEKNNAALECEKNLLRQLNCFEITYSEAISLAWMEGMEYGKKHADELKIFDKE